MNDAGDLLYQAVRFAFTLSLLALLLVLLRASIRGLLTADAGAFTNGAIDGPSATLQVVDGAETSLSAGMTRQIAGRTVVGRSPGCQVVLDDPSVSAIHAELRPAADGWLLVDLGSTNGTWLGGHPVVEPVPICDGDLLQFGRVRFRLMC
jgi:pSer/pThr/pTyr-binding forkhead associated (FHA) protein